MFNAKTSNIKCQSFFLEDVVLEEDIAGEEMECFRLHELRVDPAQKML
jgi:hypothetical protein